MRLRLIHLLFFSLLLSGAIAYAQSDECSVDNIDACTVNLTMFCLKEGAVPFSFGINNDFDLEFAVTFPGKPPAKILPIFAVNGVLENGSTDEPRITKLRCKGSRCSSAITLEEINALERRFDFDQTFINFVVRLRGKNGKDLCVSKFTNNQQLIEDNGRSKQVVCSLNPTSGNESIVSSGYFAAAGYGSRGNAQFHLNVQGLEAGRTYRGCNRLGAGSYRSVFSFTPALLATVTDASIYGALSPREQAAFDERPADYSYDLNKLLLPQADPVGGQFAPSLSLINKGVSPSTAGNSLRESNRSSRVKRRNRKRARKKKGKRVRSATISADIAGDVSVQAIEQRVLGLLPFDPQGDQILISEKCNGDVESEAVARLVCGDDAEDDSRSCEDIQSSNEDVKGTICVETDQAQVGKVTIRAQGLDAGNYTICLNGSAIQTELFITDQDGTPSGLQKLTDNETLASNDPQFELIEQSVIDAVSEIETVGISSGNCNDLDASASF